MATNKGTTRGKTKKTAAKKSSKAASAKTQASTRAKATKKTKGNLFNLSTLNIALALVLLIQVVLLLVFSNGHSVPIVEHFIAKDTLESQASGQAVWATALQRLFDLNLAIIIAATLLVAAIIRGLAGSLWAKHFNDDLNKKVNCLRWAEYATAGGLLLLTVGLVNGINDISTLILLFGLNLVAALYMYSSEKYNLKLAPWIVNSFVVLTTLLPWLIIAQYIKGAFLYGDGLPGYAYWVNGVLFALYLIGAYNYFRISRSKGRWGDYAYGEKLTMLITFVSYSALAWIVFVGLLK